MNGSRNSWRLQSVGGAQRLEVSEPSGDDLFFDKDRLVIDTRAGQRRITRVRKNGQVMGYTNLLPYLTNNPTWFQLKKGINTFEAVPNAGGAYSFNSLIFNPQNWGI
jgi:hypothetical protein